MGIDNLWFLIFKKARIKECNSTRKRIFLEKRYWTQIRPDGLIFGCYQVELKSFGKFQIFTKSGNNV